MRCKWTTAHLAVLATVIAAATLIVEARRVVLRPLTSREVYAILKAAGREDAIPEGRVVTQGLAAATGFALGVASGVGGSILFDVATSNATTQWLNNMNFTLLSNADYAALFSEGLGNNTFSLNSFNLTSLFGSKGGSSTNTTTSTTPFTSQEICFQSRSMNYGRQGRQDMDYDGPEGRQAPTSPTTPTTTTTGAGTGTTAPTTSTITSPTSATSPTTGTTGSGTTVDNGGSTSTDTGTTTTDNGSGSGTTCIVIQKPKARHRRRRSVVRKHKRQHLK